MPEAPRPPEQSLERKADLEPRCPVCDRKLAEEVTRPWRFVCPRCHAVTTSPLA